MITLEADTLTFRFPEIHRLARLSIVLNRTLRVPDDDKTYPLPAGLGRFPLRHVEDYEGTLPESWRERGGVIMPMYQSEAMWIQFIGSYPMAIKIATGKINAVTGSAWTDDLGAEPQDYLTTPTQPWLDGFSTGSDQVRQFVASRLGDGQTAEEQLTGEAEFGGLQIIVYPLKAEIFEQEEAERRRKEKESSYLDSGYLFCLRSGDAMGLGLGGKIQQTVYKDDRGIDAWEETASRCFVHIINSQQWRAATGETPPHSPITKKQYKSAKIPWFHYYDERAKGLSGSSILSRLKSFGQFQRPGSTDNKSMSITRVVTIRRSHRVSEGQF